MNLTIDVSPEELQRVESARANGIDVDSKIRELLRDLPEPVQVPPRRELKTSTARLIQSWIDDGDEEEQRETFDAIREGLNESHSSYRKIFP